MNKLQKVGSFFSAACFAAGNLLFAGDTPQTVEKAAETANSAAAGNTLSLEMLLGLVAIFVLIQMMFCVIGFILRNVLGPDSMPLKPVSGTFGKKEQAAVEDAETEVTADAEPKKDPVLEMLEMVYSSVNSMQNLHEEVRDVKTSLTTTVQREAVTLRRTVMGDEDAAGTAFDLARFTDNGILLGDWENWKGCPRIDNEFRSLQLELQLIKSFQNNGEDLVPQVLYGISRLLVICYEKCPSEAGVLATPAEIIARLRIWSGVLQPYYTGYAVRIPTIGQAVDNGWMFNNQNWVAGVQSVKSWAISKQNGNCIHSAKVN